MTRRLPTAGRQAGETGRPHWSACAKSLPTWPPSSRLPPAPSSPRSRRCGWRTSPPPRAFRERRCYYYFAGKDDILAFLLRAMLDDLTHVAVGAAEGTGAAPERLGAVIRAQLDHLNSHPTLSQLLIANLGRAGKLPDIAARVNDGFIDPVKRVLAEGAAEGSLRALSDDDLGASALFGAVLVIGLRSLVTEGSIDVDRVMSMIGPMFWSGIAPNPADPMPG